MEPKQTQLENPLGIVSILACERGIGALYLGCGSLAVGTMMKGGVRFFFYDNIKQMLATSPVFSGTSVFL